MKVNNNKQDLIIQVKNLTKKFEGKVAVDAVSLNVKKGEIFGVLGPNGSGKTTTIRMICGLLTPNAGEGTCLGYDILTQAYEIKRQVGYMTQKFSLYQDLTIYENLRFMAKVYNIPDQKNRIEEAMNSLGIERKRIDQLAGTLSGGWQQRLALTAALLHNPALLLLDEPTAGVDPKARREFWNEIISLSEKGTTIFVSTHYMDEAAHCDRLAYFTNGHILIEGTMDEILKETNLPTLEDVFIKYVSS